jgi:hypothetical protein
VRVILIYILYSGIKYSVFYLEHFWRTKIFITINILSDYFAFPENLKSNFRYNADTPRNSQNLRWVIGEEDKIESRSPLWGTKSILDMS